MTERSGERVTDLGNVPYIELGLAVLEAAGGLFCLTEAALLLGTSSPGRSEVRAMTEPV